MFSRVAINEVRFGYETAKLAGTDYNPDIDMNFARIHEGHYLGGVVYKNYTGTSISMHIGSTTPHWVNRDMLWVSFDYPFRQLAVKRIFGFVPENNEHALAFDQKAGFRPVARIPGFYEDDIDCIVVCMELTDCRFLSIKPRTITSGEFWN
jgi:RimJ/RimL family protein N-acetyltransferase